MIVGIGIDLVDVAPFAERLDRTPALRKVFSASERAYAAARPAHEAEILAARWAAREALGKALGTGLRFGWDWAELEVVRNDAGQPTFAATPLFQKLVPQGTVHLTLTHTPMSAGAVVIIERP